MVGKVGKAHGTKGELKIFSFSGDPESISRYRELTLVSPDGRLSPAFKVVRARPSKKETITQLEGVMDRDQAENLRGWGVLAKKSALPRLSGDQFYLHELEGIRVRTEDGRVLGRVEAFFDNGANDILVVRGDGEEYLIPLISGMITERDKTWLTIAPPSGLLEINSGDNEGSR
ncbi:MAG: ribosome maturation factor RimM [Thermodesulfobacteriota bacterium]